MSGSSPRKRFSAANPASLAQQVLAGDIRAVSRLMTLIENGEPAGAAALQHLDRPGQPGLILGITGYPGAGKSTLIAQLAAAYRRQGRRVAVIAVDASSPITGGALLGDRIRMQDLACDPEVFIRSVASRGRHGGLAASTPQMVRVLEAAGYDVMLIETVGVGQEEVAIVGLAQTVLAVVAPGLGDEVQAMKAGLYEVAHIVVVNKGDHEGSESTIRDLKDWVPTVIRTVATKGEGIPELIEAIAAHQRARDLKRTKA